MSSIIESTIHAVIRTPHYPIIVGKKLYSDMELFELTSGQRAFIVTNEEVAQHYLMPLLTSFTKAGIEVDYIILPAGEEQKSIAGWQAILDALFEKEHTRHSVLIALGGGVICDVAGFAAATFQRGIRYISVPTTLLSQVDASVGGKTAINHASGKNMIGAFHFPSSVIIDIDSLKSLNDREFSSGIAEVIKYGVILDKAFFVWLERHIDKLLARDDATLLLCIQRCCQLKSDLVQQDEREQNLRALLNFGHTFGHAIETLVGLGRWLHGEAISVGMLMATQLACQLGMATQKDAERLKILLQRARLPINRPTNLDDNAYLPIMKRDKKRADTAIRCVLNRGLGEGEIIDIIDTSLLINAIKGV